MTIFGGALVVLTGFYVFFVLRVYVGVSRLRHQPRGGSPLRAAVVIAARNEASSIEACLRSVLAQDLPAHALQIIVVDDASTDATAEIVRRVSAEQPRITLVSLPPRPETGVGGKPEAIRAGVEQSAAEIVITTDADCEHPPTWVNTMVSYFSPGTALVAGPVVLKAGGGLFGRVERLDFLGLVVSGAGSIGSGRPIICNGANLAYRRDAYLRAQENVQRSSNDDGTLMSRIVTRSLGSVAFAYDLGAMVTTPAQGSLRAFFRQRRRWAAVAGRFLDPTIYLELVLLFVFFATLIGATVISFWIPELIPAVVNAWCIKIAVDLLPLLTVMRAWGIERRWSEVALAELFHPFSIVIATVLSLVVPFRWKDRTLRR
ncbi:MAG: glycosyltransferase [Bacteroidetes bacterium]|jgi:cellulose synthase/poly-beta-1,6-N-acetylglucosamine synthase-like glycosyltransferase|nr:glycosyltransferase [Bacteroidota bacterium]